MKIHSAAMVIVGVAVFLPSCTGETWGGNQAAANGSVVGSDGSWLVAMSQMPTTYPARTKGSAYSDLLNSVITELGGKDEFETYAQHQTKLEKLPENVRSRFGQIFAFRSFLPETSYNADSGLFKVNHSGETKATNHLTLGSEHHDGAHVIYSMNVQGCAASPSVKLEANQARAIKTGIEARGVGVFYVGAIDFSKKGWVAKDTLSNHETIPGFHATAFETSTGITAAWDVDINVARIDFVDLESGRILASIPCG